MTEPRHIQPGYLSQPEAATYLNVSDSTLEEWIRKKGIPFYRPGWERRFKKEDLDSWMNSFKDVRRKQRKPRTTTLSIVDAKTAVNG